MPRIIIPSRLAWLLLPISLLGCNGAADHTASAATDAPVEAAEAIPVEMAQVARGSMAEVYSTSATLRADKRATVNARTTGVIRRLVVEEGDRVESGEVLAELEDGEQRIAFERATSTRDTRRRELERQQALHRQGLVSDDVLEALRRESEDAEHAASLAELTLSRTVIRAPFAGVILERHVDVGSTVSDGAVLFDLADMDPLYADVNVPERHAVGLTAAEQVRLSLDATADQVIARVERISPDVDPATGTVKVTIAVPPTGPLRPGSFARVAIVTDTHAGTLVVPRAALVAEGSRWSLFRLTGDGSTVEQLPVEIGFEEGDRVEILRVVGEDARTLAVGDAIVVTGAPALRDGAAVRVIEAEPPSS